MNRFGHAGWLALAQALLQVAFYVALFFYVKISLILAGHFDFRLGAACISAELVMVVAAALMQLCCVWNVRLCARLIRREDTGRDPRVIRDADFSRGVLARWSGSVDEALDDSTRGRCQWLFVLFCVLAGLVIDLIGMRIALLEGGGPSRNYGSPLSVIGLAGYAFLGVKEHVRKVRLERHTAVR